MHFPALFLILISSYGITIVQSQDKDTSIIDIGKDILLQQLLKKNASVDLSKESEKTKAALFNKVILLQLIDFDSAVLACDFKNEFCRYQRSLFSPNWKLIVANQTGSLQSSGKIENVKLHRIVIKSPKLTGVNCLLFKLFTNKPHIIFTITVDNGHNKTIIGVPGGHKHLYKVTVGYQVSKPYWVLVSLFNSKYHGTSVDGIGWLAKMFIKKGVCPFDKKEEFTCSFTGNLCDWVHTMNKHNWYPVPFEMHNSKKGKAIWGAFGALEKKSKLWSPVILPNHRRCFTFTYIKANNAFLKIWIKYKMPSGIKKVLIYQDMFGIKRKETVSITLFAPYTFQIEFEGTSHHVYESTIILETSLKRRLCKGLGTLLDIREEVLRNSKSAKSFIGSNFF